MSPERMLQRMDSEKVVTFTTALMTGLSGAMASVLLLVMTVVLCCLKCATSLTKCVLR